MTGPTPRTHADVDVVGMVVSDDWEDTAWLSTVSEYLAEDEVRLVLPCRSGREFYTLFLAQLDGMDVVEAKTISETVEQAERLLIYGPRTSRRLRKARAAAQAKGIQYLWYTRRPRSRLKLRKRSPRRRA